MEQVRAMFMFVFKRGKSFYLELYYFVEYLRGLFFLASDHTFIGSKIMFRLRGSKSNPLLISPVYIRQVSAMGGGGEK